MSEEFQLNVTTAAICNSSQGLNCTAELTALGASTAATPPGRSSWDEFSWVTEKILVPTICASGLIGNTLCISVLAMQRLRRRMESQERVVHVGLMSMALAEMLFCVSLLPRSFIHESSIHLPSGSFALFYQLYSTGFLTTFSLVSTWLIVVTAGIRYLGICHPLRARYLVSPKGVYMVISSIVVVSIIGNLPTFWIYTTIPMDKGFELIDRGPLGEHKAVGVALLWGRKIFGVFVPGILLAYFNTRLILALRASRKLQQESVHAIRGNPNQHASSSATHHHQEASRNRLTRTLVAVVVMFILLVFPSELMDFTMLLTRRAIVDYEAFLVARVITNLMQVCNFAFNFVFYCVLSANFRKTLAEMYAGCFERQSNSRAQEALLGSASCSRTSGEHTQRTCVTKIDVNLTLAVR